jgi:hypothetical protein
VSAFARCVFVLFDASLLRADNDDDKDVKDDKDDVIAHKDAEIAVLRDKLDKLAIKPKRAGKWKVEHAKVVADVEPLLPTIKTFDCNRLYWLAQHMAQQRRKCLDRDTKAKASVNNYTRWISKTRCAGKLSRDVSSDIVESEEQSEEEEEEDQEEEDDDVGYKKMDLSKM